MSVRNPIGFIVSLSFILFVYFFAVVLVYVRAIHFFLWLGIPNQTTTSWHNDSGFLTALAGDLYVDHDTGYCVPNPDPHAGLYVLDRNQVCHRLELPPDCVMVQIGECTQIVTGGIVAATPHCVRGIQLPTMTVTTTLSDAGNVARISMACFVDTPPQFPLRVPLGSSRSAVLAAGASGSASSSSCKDNDDDDRSWGLRQRVPPLDDRWISDGMTFGDFLQRTFSAYYE